MALQDKYVDTNLQNDKLGLPAFTSHDDLRAGLAIAEIANADNANSVYRLFKAVKGEMVLADLELSFDAFGAGGLIDLGIHESGIGGAAKDQNAFASAVDVSAAANKQNGLAAIDLANRQMKIWELAGDTEDTKKAEYDITLTITAKGATGLGTVLAKAEFLQG